MKIVIEISGNDTDKLDADGVTETVFYSLNSDGYDVEVTGYEVDD